MGYIAVFEQMIPSTRELEGREGLDSAAFVELTQGEDVVDVRLAVPCCAVLSPTVSCAGIVTRSRHNLSRSLTQQRWQAQPAVHISYWFE